MFGTNYPSQYQNTFFDQNKFGVQVSSLVLKARNLSGSAFCVIITGMPEKALEWLPLGLGLVMEDEPSKLSCTETT